MRSIGLHLRLNNSLQEIMSVAQEYPLESFQCFFVASKTGKRLHIRYKDIKNFRKQRSQYAKNLYVHASYWTNLSSTKRVYHPVLEYELQVARRLGFTHIILHPGSYGKKETKRQGIEAIARTLNYVMNKEEKIVFVLENIAHSNRSIGGNFFDFVYILRLLDFPERLRFCIDTAHAFAYGYNIKTVKGRNSLIAEIEKTIGIESVALIHMNDSKSSYGSKIDHHASLNKEHIKQESLKEFVLHEKLKHIPIILELPQLSMKEEIVILKEVYSWHHTSIMGKKSEKSLYV